MERDHGVTLWPVRNVGYELAPIDKQIGEIARNRIGRAGRQVHKAIKHVTAPIVGELTVHQQAKRAFVYEALRRRRSELHGESVRQGIFAKKSEGVAAHCVPYT